MVTGPRGQHEPVNSVLPAWDIALGGIAATGLLAADRHRHRTGAGQLVRASLSDVAFSMVANLGRVAQAHTTPDSSVEKDGNFLYGSFGAPFVTKDQRFVMVVGLTPRQWKALESTTGLDRYRTQIERVAGVDLETETGRFNARDHIAQHLRLWFEHRSFDDAAAALDAGGVAWGLTRVFSSYSTIPDCLRLIHCSRRWNNQESEPTRCPARRSTSALSIAPTRAERRSWVSTQTRF